MYKYKTSKQLDRILKKFSKKDKQLYKQIFKKIDEVINSSDIKHYKNLRCNMQDFKRVYIGHFVLVFKFNKKENIIYFTDFEHHNKIYRK